MTYLLDANVCIVAMAAAELFSGDGLRVHQRIARSGQGVCTSVVVLGELLYGVSKSARQRDNRRKLDRFLEYIPVLDLDALAAEHYGDIRAALERVGTPIGSNDTLIAGHARSLGYTLVTNNRREFDRVPGLKVETWLA